VLGVAVWSLVAVAVDRPLSRALNVPADGAVALTLIAGGVWLLLCIDRAVLQVHRRYRSLGENLLVEIGTRTALVLSFAAAGFGVPGFAVGLLVGELVAAGHAHLVAERAWSYPADTGHDRRTRASSRTLSYDLMAALAGFALIGVLQNADIILIGRLDPSSSGPYAAISVASKALVFGAILLGSYMLPETAIRWHRGEHALRQFAVTLLFLGVPTVFLLAAALIAPKQFLTVFFGARLSTSAPGFATLVGAMACLGVTVLVTNYLFGAARRWVVLLLAAGVACLVVLIHRAGGSVVATARAELEVQAGLAVLLALAFGLSHLRFHPKRRTTPETPGMDSVKAE
jgi:O-antigen/teichoic acid export membrane protein